MFVSHKDISKKTHVMYVGFNKYRQEQFFTTECGSGVNGRGTWEETTYELREIASVDEIANENLCKKCFAKVGA